MGAPPLGKKPGRRGAALGEPGPTCLMRAARLKLKPVQLTQAPQPFARRLEEAPPETRCTPVFVVQGITGGVHTRWRLKRSASSGSAADKVLDMRWLGA